MGKKFNELAELRDRSRQLMDENRRLRLALKVSEERAQQLAWKKAELEKQVEKGKRTRELFFNIAEINAEAIEAIMTSVHEVAGALIQKKQDALRAYDEKAAKRQEPHAFAEGERGRKC